MFARWTGGYLEAWQSAPPDLRRFLVGTATWSAFGSIFWVDFGPYLLAIGLTPAELGLVMAGVSLAGALAAVPAGLVADLLGRRAALVAGQAITTLGLLGLVLAPGPAAVGLLAAAVGAGNTVYFVVGPPFLTESSEPHHRDRFFAAYYAIGQAVGAVAPIVLAGIAAALAAAAGDTSAAAPYRVLVVIMAVLSAITLLVFAMLRERPTAERAEIDGRVLDPRSLLPSRRARRPFALILLMSGLVALGAGQLIPFLNVFVQRRFGLDLVALNAIFAIASLGTLAATLAQPWLAARLGRVHAVVALQVASLPFIFVLGWGPGCPSSSSRSSCGTP